MTYITNINDAVRKLWKEVKLLKCHKADKIHRHHVSDIDGLEDIVGKVSTDDITITRNEEGELQLGFLDGDVTKVRSETDLNFNGVEFKKSMQEHGGFMMFKGEDTDTTLMLQRSHIDFYSKGQNGEFRTNIQSGYIQTEGNEAILGIKPGRLFSDRGSFIIPDLEQTNFVLPKRFNGVLADENGDVNIPVGEIKLDSNTLSLNDNDEIRLGNSNSSDDVRTFNDIELEIVDDFNKVSISPSTLEFLQNGLPNVRHNNYGSFYGSENYNTSVNSSSIVVYSKSGKESHRMHIGNNGLNYQFTDEEEYSKSISSTLIFPNTYSVAKIIPVSVDNYHPNTLGNITTGYEERISALENAPSGEVLVDNKTISKNGDGELQLGDSNGTVKPERKLDIQVVGVGSNNYSSNLRMNPNSIYLSTLTKIDDVVSGHEIFVEVDGVKNTLEVDGVEYFGKTATVPFVLANVGNDIQLSEQFIEVDGKKTLAFESQVGNMVGLQMGQMPGAGSENNKLLVLGDWQPEFVNGEGTGVVIYEADDSRKASIKSVSSGTLGNGETSISSSSDASSANSQIDSSYRLTEGKFNSASVKNTSYKEGSEFKIDVREGENNQGGLSIGASFGKTSFFAQVDEMTLVRTETGNSKSYKLFDYLDRVDNLKFSDQFMLNENGEYMLGYTTDEGLSLYGLNSVTNETGLRSAFIGNYESLLKNETGSLIITAQNEESSVNQLINRFIEPGVESSSQVVTQNTSDLAITGLESKYNNNDILMTNALKTLTSKISKATKTELTAYVRTEGENSVTKEASIDTFASDILSSISFNSEYLRARNKLTNETYELFPLFKGMQRIVDKITISLLPSEGFEKVVEYGDSTLVRVGDVVYFNINMTKSTNDLSVGDVVLKVPDSYLPFKPLPILAKNDLGVVALELQLNGDLVVTELSSARNPSQVYCSGSYLSPAN